ncbi:MAG: ankyrin repeat domain-containing protein [Gemmataceae bacterium]
MAEVSLQKRIREAIKAGDDAAAEALIASDPEQIAAMTVFGTWMHVAASHGRLRVVQSLARAGADVNARGGISGGTPLNEAASHGHQPIVQFLLSAGAVMETREPEVNPLFSACYGGHPDVVRLLLASGIDAGVRYTGPRMQDMDVVAFARERGQLAIAELIAAHLAG